MERTHNDRQFKPKPPNKTIVEQYAFDHNLRSPKFPYFRNFESHLERSELNPGADRGNPEKFATRKFQKLTILESILAFLKHLNFIFICRLVPLIPIMHILFDGSKNVFSYQTTANDYLNEKNAKFYLKQGLNNLGLSEEQIFPEEQLEKIYQGKLNELKSRMADRVQQRSSEIDKIIAKNNDELYEEYMYEKSELERERYSVLYGPPYGFPEGRLP